MDKKSKILYIVIIIAAVISLGMTYYRTIILHSFNTVENPSRSGE